MSSHTNCDTCRLRKLAALQADGRVRVEAGRILLALENDSRFPFPAPLRAVGTGTGNRCRTCLNPTADWKIQMWQRAPTERRDWYWPYSTEKRFYR
jgi:hypothetical protein